MPMYEYGCTQCGKKTEIIQKFSDAPLTLCPACGGPVDRLISASGFVLKGGGWYKDGYTSNKETAATSETAAATSEKPVEKGQAESPTCEKTGKPADASCACANAAKTTSPAS